MSLFYLLIFGGLVELAIELARRATAKRRSGAGTFVILVSAEAKQLFRAGCQNITLPDIQS